MKQLILFALLALFCPNVRGAALDENFGYVDVRTGAHMFWVVYHTELAGNWSTHPLIMWLQGGPGASGVGYGNFQELGPYYINGTLRPGRWTQKANLMFVDNPVGTGYSYVDDSSLYTKNNTQIADDLVTLLISVFTSYPEMQIMPFFVYAESYGGKMTADFAIALDRAITNGDITCNFQGIAMGDSWVSPMDSVNTWGPYLYGMGFVNRDGEANINQAAARTQAAVDAGNWVQATLEWSNTEGVVLQETDGVDFYNVLAEDSSVYDFQASITDERAHSYMQPEVRDLYFRHVIRLSNRAQDELSDFMNGAQATQWNIPAGVVWGGQSGEVFNHLMGDFMKPVIDSVTYLLDNVNIHVAVYSGDLDLICDTPGTYQWIENMQYTLKPNYEATLRQSLNIPLYPNNAAYVQRYQTFSVFTILRSGHMVPIDAPDMCLDMIDLITQYGSEAVVPKSKVEKVMNKVEEVHAKLKEAKKDVEHKEEILENLKEKEEQVDSQHEAANEEAEKQVPQLPEKKEEKKEIITKLEKVKEHVQDKKEKHEETAEKKKEIKQKINTKIQQKKQGNDDDVDDAVKKLFLNNPAFQKHRPAQHPRKAHH